VKKEEIPADLVTASGSGLDPHISPASAYIQVKRIASVRNLQEVKIKSLVDEHVQNPILGPSFVHVLKLNISLDNLK
jgi:K+-transporting ATPase ATPase C chain